MEELSELQETLHAQAAELASLKATLTAEVLEKAQAQQQAAQLAAQLELLRPVIAQGHLAAAAHAKDVQLLTELLREHSSLQDQHAQLLLEKQSLALAAGERNVELLTMKRQLEQEREEHTQQTTALKAAHDEELKSLHMSYTGRLSSLESFKNSALAAKRSAEEQLAKERAAWRSQGAVTPFVHNTSLDVRQQQVPGLAHPQAPMHNQTRRTLSGVLHHAAPSAGRPGKV